MPAFPFPVSQRNTISHPVILSASDSNFTRPDKTAAPACARSISPSSPEYLARLPLPVRAPRTSCRRTESLASPQCNIRWLRGRCRHWRSSFARSIFAARTQVICMIRPYMARSSSRQFGWRLGEEDAILVAGVMAPDLVGGEAVEIMRNSYCARTVLLFGARGSSSKPPSLNDGGSRFV